MTETTRNLSIAREFSDTPFGRYREDGPEAGQVFREDVLIPALKMGRVVLDIDGVEGLPSSFWEEVMGGAVREGFSVAKLHELLTIVSNEPELQTFIRSGWRFADEAAQKTRAH